jgi:hypothetical protein
MALVLVQKIFSRRIRILRPKITLEWCIEDYVV